MYKCVYSKHTEKNSGCIGKMLTLFLRGCWNCRYFFFFTESMVKRFETRKRWVKMGLRTVKPFCTLRKQLKLLIKCLIMY